MTEEQDTEKEAITGFTDEEIEVLKNAALGTQPHHYITEENKQTLASLLSKENPEIPPYITEDAAVALESKARKNDIKPKREYVLVVSAYEKLEPALNSQAPVIGKLEERRKRWEYWSKRPYSLRCINCHYFRSDDTKTHPLIKPLSPCEKCGSRLWQTHGATEEWIGGKYGILADNICEVLSGLGVISTFGFFLYISLILAIPSIGVTSLLFYLFIFALFGGIAAISSSMLNRRPGYAKQKDFFDIDFEKPE